MHPVARSGFSRAADRYDRGRPEYPAEAVQLLGTLFDLTSASRIVELGAGTGKFTRALAAQGLRPLAIEPIPAMRRELRRHGTPVDLLAGVAEALPFRDHSVDAVVAAQAFHWFGMDRALPELGRVLRPWGGVGLVWNVRDERIGWQRELGRLLRAHREKDAPPTHQERRWRDAFRRSPLFEPLAVRSFRFDQLLDAAAFEDRIGSVSYVAQLPPERRDALFGELRRATERAPREADGRLRMRYRTDLYYTRRRAVA